MIAFSLGDPGHERSLAVLDRHFEPHADYWRDVYAHPTVAGLVYRRRMQIALAWIDALGLDAGTPALDAGCGAGLLAVALARRGLAVTASDGSPAMLASAKEAAARSDPPVELTLTQSYAEELPFADGSFTLVTALGLLPWLPDPARGVGELLRVLTPGGWLLATADNRARLSFLFEPSQNPLLAPVKTVRDGLRRARGQEVPEALAHLDRPAEVDRLLRAAGAEPVRRTTVGFGPFTFRGHRLLPEPIGIAVHERLERASARESVLRRTGWHYVVLARKR